VGGLGVASRLRAGTTSASGATSASVHEVAGGLGGWPGRVGTSGGEHAVGGDDASQGRRRARPWLPATELGTMEAVGKMD
jgi:hypothetical protein